MKLSIIILIVVLVVGSIVISLGFFTNQEYVNVSDISTQYDKLEKYKNELEKINQSNRQILKDLEDKFKNSNDVNLEQLNEEIDIVKRVIDQNKVELEQIIKELSQMEYEN